MEHIFFTEAMQEFVKNLDKLAQKNFPLKAVNDFLNRVYLSPMDLQPYTFFDTRHYTRNLIYGCPAFELILLCWEPKQDSPIHGHEGEKCWMRVEEGSLRFINYVGNSNDPASLKPISDTHESPYYVDGPAYIHQVANESNNKAISLHLYARPFHQCDIYDLNAAEIKKVGLSFFSIHGKRIH